MTSKVKSVLIVFMRTPDVEKSTEHRDNSTICCKVEFSLCYDLLSSASGVNLDKLTTVTERCGE